MADPTTGDRTAPKPVPLIPLRDREWPGSRLPVLLTSFIGRESDVQAVTRLLRGYDVRLVTLTGPGGVGKTRLALRVAAELEFDFADGVVFVPLAPVAHPDLVPSTVAQALGVREVGDQPVTERLAAALRERHLLLILDNFEHVLPAAMLVTDLLTACPKLTVLTTSRATLQISGEQMFPVPPLALPKPSETATADQAEQAETVRLFVERARAVSPNFALTDTNALPVTEIVRRLDGLPLAIELAAARANVLSPNALLGQLDHQLSLLAGGPRDAPERLRSMRDAIAWSHDLLTAEEQTLFRQLSVFVGGCTLDAAEAVTEDRSAVLDGITSLANKSLLRQEVGSDDEPRYFMLETIREYALEQLMASSDEATALERHAAYYLALAEQSDRELWGPRHGRWIDRLAQDSGNLRAALAWAVENQQVEIGLRLTAALWKFMLSQGLWPNICLWQERLLLQSGDVPESLRATSLWVAGDFARCVGDYDSARALIDQSLALARRLDDRLIIAQALYAIGTVEEDCGDIEEAAARYEEAVPLIRDIDAGWWLPETISSLGRTARKQGDYRRAQTLHEEALKMLEDSGGSWGVAWVTTALGEATADAGDNSRAAELFRRGLRMHLQLGDHMGIGFCLIGLGKLASADGRSDHAARLLGAAEALRESCGFALSPVDRGLFNRYVERTRTDLGDERFYAAWAEGKLLRPEEEIAEALALPLTKEAPPAGSVEDTTGSGLSNREVEVLRLLASGKTDAEIAEVLFVSRRTVTTHVVNIYNKLGVDNRAAAAAWAVRQGLA